MAEPDTVSGPRAPNHNPPTAEWDRGTPTESLPGGSTPGSHRADRSTNSVLTGVVPVGVVPPPGPDPDLPNIPGYRLLEVLGRGGMGTVYRAVHLDLAREVALKLIHPGGRDEVAVRARFEREIRSLARIDHPNIVRVYDAGSWQGFPYFTMKYVPGGALSQHLDRVQGDPRAACRLVAKVARAVHRLHAEGVVHRDLKPANILLGEGDEPLVADFGLAKWLGDDSDLTVTGALMGTRQYMAPEQTRGQKAECGPACDVWALGVILYEVLTGRRPFADDDPVELYRRIREEWPAPCRPTETGGSPGLEAVVRRCLAKDPADRYATAGQVAEDLERWLAGETVTAPPAEPEPAGPAKAPVPTRRSLRWAAVAVGLLAAAGIGAVLKPWHSAGPVPAAKPTLADRVRAGERVTLVGPSGLPVVDFVPAPQSSERLSAERDGFCTLSSRYFAAIDLVQEELPLPIRLEAEFALTDSRQEQGASWASVFVGRKAWPGPTGPHYSQAQVTLTEERVGADREGVQFVDRVATGVLWWDTPRNGLLTEMAAGAAERRTEKYRPPGTEQRRGLIWRKVTLTLTEQDVRATWKETPMAPVPADRVVGLIRGVGKTKWRAAPPPVEPPAFGPGIGIAVYNAEAVFRNLTLTRPSP